MKNWQILLLATTIAFASAAQKLVTEEFSTTAFTNDAAVGWVATGNTEDMLVSTCDKVSLFGGYNVFGNGAKAEKAYNSQVDHYELVISFDLYNVDSWDNENFKVVIDDEVVYKYNHNLKTAKPRMVVCGDKSYADSIQSVSFTVSHFRRDFTLRLSSDLDQISRDESWGIRDLQILANYDNEALTLVSEEFLQSKFVDSKKGWEFVGVTLGQEFSNCGPIRVLGGYDIFGQNTVALKKVEGLADHLALVINFDLYQIDSWDGNDSVQLIVDGQLFALHVPKNYVANQEKVCGNNGFEDFVKPISIFVPHIAANAQIQFKGIFDQAKNDESFGIFNLRIYTFQTSSATPSVVIKDLFGLSAASALSGWYDEKTKAATSAMRTCSGQTFLGPFSQEVSKTIKGLAAHNGVRVSLKLLTLGNWAGNARVRFLVNNAWANVYVGDDFVKSQICDSANEQIRNVYFDVPHFSDTFELKIGTNNFESNSVYFLRDLIVIPYTNKDFNLSVQDLNTADINAANWLIVKNTNNLKTTVCGSLSLLGGHKAFGDGTSVTRTFDIAETHTFIRLTAVLYFVDTGDTDEAIWVYVEDELVQKIVKSNCWLGNSHLCGLTNSKEEAVYIDVTIKHNKPTVKIIIKDNFNQDTTDESWGVRDLYIQTLQYRVNPTYSNGGGNSVSVYNGKIDNCVKVFSACDFQGEMFPICDSISNLVESGWNKPIKSVQIPTGKVLQLYDQTEFKGDGSKLTTSQACLTGKTFLLVNKAFNIEVEPEQENQTRLRVQKSF